MTHLAAATAALAAAASVLGPMSSDSAVAAVVARLTAFAVAAAPVVAVKGGNHGRSGGVGWQRHPWGLLPRRVTASARRGLRGAVVTLGDSAHAARVAPEGGAVGGGGSDSGVGGFCAMAADALPTPVTLGGGRSRRTSTPRFASRLPPRGMGVLMASQHCRRSSAALSLGCRAIRHTGGRGGRRADTELGALAGPAHEAAVAHWAAVAAQQAAVEGHGVGGDTAGGRRSWVATATAAGTTIPHTSLALFATLTASAGGASSGRSAAVVAAATRARIEAPEAVTTAAAAAAAIVAGVASPRGRIGGAHRDGGAVVAAALALLTADVVSPLRSAAVAANLDALVAVAAAATGGGVGHTTLAATSRVRAAVQALAGAAALGAARAVVVTARLVATAAALMSPTVVDPAALVPAAAVTAADETTALTGASVASSAVVGGRPGREPLPVPFAAAAAARLPAV
ncbi:hypothetical protein MMPV_010141 [Pyropia vietnamensis]